jgi:predicted kinase
MLVVFGGLPGTGKTTIAREVARQTSGTYLRIDTIEQALRTSDFFAADVGPLGYEIAYALAKENLRIGKAVIADSVNPIALTRSPWRSIADQTSSPILEFEIICSDAREHRRRIESRTVDVPGLVLPDWSAVLAREYEPRTDARTVIDTSEIDFRQAASNIVARMTSIASAPKFDQQSGK